MNNREISILVWCLIGLMFLLTKKDIRDNIGQMIKLFFGWKLMISHLLMAGYITGIVLILSNIGLWNQSLLKDTLVWAFFGAFVVLVKSIKGSTESGFFKNEILDNIKVVAIIEFISNTYTFSLVTELILIPILTFWVAISATASLKKESLRVKVLADVILIIIGLVFLVYALNEAITDYKNFTSVNNLLSFVLPLILTSLFIPFLYLELLWMAYEDFFVRVNGSFRKNPTLRKSVKQAIFKYCSFNLYKVRKFAKAMRVFNIETEIDVLIEIDRVKNLNQI